MQNHSRRGRKSSRRRGKSPQEKSFFKKLFDAFRQLSDPTQTVLIIGLLLLLGWLIANPLILVNLLKVILGLITIRAALKEM